MNVTHISILENGEYGEFFVGEREPQPRSDGGMRYSATWCCYSSFGVFGHYWYDMGEPFAEFVSGTDRDYVLSKITQMEFDDETCLDGVRHELSRRRRNKYITAEIAREGWNCIDAIASDASGEALAYSLYNDSDVAKAVGDFIDIPTRRYPRAAERFMDKLWPLFVKELSERAAVTN